jgi:hypothetical protein
LTTSQGSDIIQLLKEEEGRTMNKLLQAYDAIERKIDGPPETSRSMFAVVLFGFAGTLIVVLTYEGVRYLVGVR